MDATGTFTPTAVDSGSFLGAGTYAFAKPFPPTCPVNRYVQEAITIHAPDEAFRVWCPNCGYVLCEYLHGVARYLCRSCKWEGVIARHSASLVPSCTTLRRGANETLWRKQAPRLVGGKADGD